MSNAEKHIRKVEGRISLSSHYLRLYAYGSDENVLASATGFIYEYEEMFYMITNAHNVTRLDANGKRLSETAAFPVRIRTRPKIEYKDKPNFVGHYPDLFYFDLYEDPEFKKSNWYVHPTLGYQVDVVAIPIVEKNKIPSGIKLYPINKFSFDSDYSLRPGDDVFILGYPLGMLGSVKLELPIWKRGTVATEPALAYHDLPMFLVDTATAKGMSGAPVLMRRNGLHHPTGEYSPQSFFGVLEDFIGVYSGRYNSGNSLEAQLGIVWRAAVIEEILEKKIRGNIDFQIA